MTWWLLKPDPGERKGMRYVQTMYISDEALVVKEKEWALRNDLAPMTKQKVSGAHLDTGGMMSVDQEILKRDDFHGGELSCHAIHVQLFLKVLGRAEKRPSGLYIVSSWPAVLMITDEQRLGMIEWLKSVEEQASAIADIENAAFNKKFTENPHPHVKVAPRPVRGKIEDA